MLDEISSLYDSLVLMNPVAGIDVSQAATVNQLCSDAPHTTICGQGEDAGSGEKDFAEIWLST